MVKKQEAKLPRSSRSPRSSSAKKPTAKEKKPKPKALPESLSSSLKALQPSPEDSKLFAALTAKFPSLVSDSLDILETAVGGTGISTKERLSLAKFLVQKGLDLQQLSQERQYAVLKAFLESQAKLASEKQTTDALLSSFKTGATSVLAGAFSGMASLGGRAGAIPAAKKVFSQEAVTSLPEDNDDNNDNDNNGIDDTDIWPDGEEEEAEESLFSEPAEYSDIPESLRRTQ